MSPPRRSLAKRVAIRAARYVLYPVTLFLPDSGWAQIYDRLGELEGRKRRARRSARTRRVSPPVAGLVLLLAAALAVFLHDVLRRPQPALAPHVTPHAAAR